MATSSDSGEDFEIDPKNANINEKRFMRTMRRQDQDELNELEDREDKNTRIKKKKHADMKKKIFIEKVLKGEIDIT